MLAAGSHRDVTISQPPPRVVFVVTVRNNAALLDRSLRSVSRQTYSATRCVVIDDASDDATATIAQNWARRWPDRFAAERAGQRRGKMANFVDAVATLDPHDVVVELDGDDRLISTEAAADLARLHMRLDLVWTQHRVARRRWQTWSHFRSTDLPPAYRHRSELPRLRWSRTWHPSLLRSFKAWAFRQISPDDLKLDGDWVRACPDVAYFCPLVEMTPAHLRYFYDRELAVYNITAANEKFQDRDRTPPHLRQSVVANELFSRPPYATRRVPLWIGLINADNHEAIVALWKREIRRDPATRMLLASDLPMRASWHPRVQIIAEYTIADFALARNERDAAAVEWLRTYAVEHGWPDRPATDAERDLPVWRYG